jgi:DNA-binding LytR/AlgR family response regulator
VDAFELRALDYLLKPVSRRRLEEALERVASAVDTTVRNGNAEPEPRGGAAGESDIVAVASSRPSGSTRLIPRSSIQYVQSHGDFVRIVVGDGRYLLRSTLTDLERRWEPFGFVRVHRQYLANLGQARELQPQLGGTAMLRFDGEVTIPVARRHVAGLTKRLAV